MTANEQAGEANKIAKQAADAATKSAEWLAFATEKQLRAYISVTAVDLTFNKTTKRAEVTVRMENTGLTFAHNLAITGTLVCVPIGGPYPTAAGEYAPPPSIGPGGVFEILVITPWQGTDPSKMDCWVNGWVAYTDEFGKPRRTQYKFAMGRPIAGTSKYQMVLTADGNSAY